MNFAYLSGDIPFPVYSPQLCGMSMKYVEQGIFSGLCEQFTIAWSVTVIHIVQSKL